MNTPTTESIPVIDVRAMFAPIQQDLQRVEELLGSEMRSTDSFVEELLGHCRQLGGKRLRPALLLLVAKAFGPVQQDHLTLAVVIEMIHTATLVHDDVLDGADQRRHLPTHRSIWGNESSVLTGDFLFSKAFFLASGLDTTHACREIGSATNIVCEGEMRQIGSCRRFDLSEAEYISIIDAKTAQLCATASYLGGCYARDQAGRPLNDKQLDDLREYGRLLGIAFQIVDDLLDFSGVEQRVGKSLGTDLEQLKPTMPLIHLLSQLDGGTRAGVIADLEHNTETTSARIGKLMKKHGSLEYTHQQAVDYANRAMALIEDLPASEASDCLRAIPEFVVMRKH